MNSINIQETISKLKSEDYKYSQLCKRFQYIYWILIPIYLIMIIRHYVSDKNITLMISSACFLIGMICFAINFNRYYKIYRFVDYSLPTIKMIKQGIKRYEPFGQNLILPILGILFTDIGLVLTTEEGIFNIRTHSIFIIAIGVGAIFGYFIWRIKYKKLRDQLKQFLVDLSE